MSLTEVQTLQRAQLEIMQENGGLSDAERWRLRELKTESPLSKHRMSLGARTATGLEFKRLAARPPHENVAVDEPVALGTVSGSEFKTLLRAGSATSVGAFQSLDPSREYQPVRRPLDLLDLVRLGRRPRGPSLTRGRRLTRQWRSRSRGHEHDDRHEARGNPSVRARRLAGGGDHVVGAGDAPRA